MARLALLVCIISIIASNASAACRLALVLALDVSGSVNEREYRQQLEGLSFALSDPDVVDLLLIDQNHVSVLAYEWSSTIHQRIIFDWTEIHSKETVLDLAKTLRSHVKDRATLKTAIGASLDFARAQLQRQDHCWQLTIDMSGDGVNNDGREPIKTRNMPEFFGVTVNALIVTQPDEVNENPVTRVYRNNKLQNYYYSDVIHGPGSFAEIAFGYEDYARAMKQKLLKELSPKLIGMWNKEIIPTSNAKGL